jgi:transcriptional regulator with XRE-family HTH domain
MQRFGEKLRSLRQQRGMTLRELASALGYASHGHLNLVENGKKEPNLELLLKVSDYFGVSADALLRDELEVDGGRGG